MNALDHVALSIARKLRSPVVAGVAAVSVVTLGYLALRAIFKDGQRSLPPGTTPPRVSAAPFAQIEGNAVWPIVTNEKRRAEVAYVDAMGISHGNSSRRFGAPRDGRNHAGIDLYANDGDPVLAIADGTVVATQSFHLGSDAILVEHHGAVVLYGEVEPGSWKEFGVSVGSRVRAGDPIARVACMVHDSSGGCDSHMLHLETYRPGTRTNEQWRGSTPPPELLDPTYLLLTLPSAH